MVVQLGVAGCENYTAEVPVIEKIYHQDFDIEKFLNDIGLLKLSSNTLEKEYINSPDGM